MGGFLGSVARYGIGKWVLGFSKAVFPLHTLFINILGCLIIGYFAGKLNVIESSRYPLSEFIIVGLLGGFTTFSTFGYEFVNLLKQNEFIQAGVYVLLSVLLGITAVWLGWSINQ